MDVREMVAGRYEIVRPIGGGGMGDVFLARQVNLDRLVVIKSARPGTDVAVLADEARLVARLHHPNIVSILDVVERDGAPILVMELVAGVPLRELIDHAPGAMPIAVALAIASDVLRGLAYAHAARVVHRDVNPSNIMVTFAGVTKIIDFGISRWLDRSTALAFAGTRGFVAPEQLRGEPVDGRADQYAFGVTLREMIAAPSAIAAIAARACGDDPAQRFASCAEMLLAIEDYLATEGIAATPTHVERWTSGQFAERRDSFERDAEVAVRSRPRTPTPMTIVAHGSQPGPHTARVAIAARNIGEPADDYLAPVIARMLRQRLDDRADRKFSIATRPDPTATRIDLEFVCDEAIQIDTVTGSSIAVCVDALADRLVARLGTDLPPPSPSARERLEMQRLGATSYPLFLRYRSILRGYLATNLPDNGPLVVRARELVAADPAWPRAHALLALLEGRTTPEAQIVIAAGLAAADPLRDPRGARLLDANDRICRGEFEAAYEVLVAMIDPEIDDLLAIFCTAQLAVVLQRADEATALARRLHHDHPELAFGADLAEIFRRAGRDSAADAVIREWLARNPENLPARVEIVRTEAKAGRMDAAAEQARIAMTIHGEEPDALPDLFEATIASEQFGIAQRLADRMLLGSVLSRGRGRYRSAIAAVFEGRFAAAYDSIRVAIEEHRAFGHASELVQTLELARSIAPLVGDRDAERRFTGELAEAFETLVGDNATSAATRYELALLDRRGGPPRIEEHLAALAEGPARDVARRRMLRAAALADLGPPHRAVAAGFSPFEENTASLVAFGLCAMRLDELDLARKSFERATQTGGGLLNTQSSPYHAVLARFHLASVLAGLGDRAGARALLESFLRCWGGADRPVPEVASARAVISSLA
jgi:tetratricopeptide (TPR) repeat protein